MPTIFQASEKSQGSMQDQVSVKNPSPVDICVASQIVKNAMIKTKSDDSVDANQIIVTKLDDIVVSNGISKTKVDNSVVSDRIMESNSTIVYFENKKRFLVEDVEIDLSARFIEKPIIFEISRHSEVEKIASEYDLDNNKRKKVMNGHRSAYNIALEESVLLHAIEVTVSQWYRMIELENGIPPCYQMLLQKSMETHLIHGGSSYAYDHTYWRKKFMPQVV